MSTLVPGSIMMSDGQRDRKTKQRTDQLTQSLEREREEMRGRGDWQVGSQGWQW